MARKGRKRKKEIEDYRHDETRPNNPPAGLMGDYEAEEPAARQERYSYDPHLDPELRFDSQGVREQAASLLVWRFASSLGFARGPAAHDAAPRAHSMEFLGHEFAQGTCETRH